MKSLPVTGTNRLLDLLDPYIPDDFINERFSVRPVRGPRWRFSAAQLWRVSGRSKAAREGRIKCSHFEVTGFIALNAALAADRSDESTQSESATIDKNSG